MTFDQLRIFLAVADCLHFTRASEFLHLTQPAVSAAIQNLEESYGVKLFHRIGRRIEITEAGRVLQMEAQRILDQVSLTERALRELNSLQRGELRLGASLTIGNYWLPNKISRFKQQYPGISVNCTLSNAEEVCEGTAIGLFDLGLITGRIKPSLREVLEPVVVGGDRLEIVVGRAHPWFGRDTIGVEDLLTTGWVMRESGSGAQQMFEQALRQWGIDVEQINIILVLSSSEMVKAVVEEGIGAAALPELMVHKERQLSTLHAVQVISPQQARKPLDIIQPVLKLKHRQRFQAKPSIAFEQLLMM